MADVMSFEHTRQKRFTNYAATLKERFASGLLAELQPLKQWLVWKGELEAGKRKKVPYNPNYWLARASVKLPNSWGTLGESLAALETGNYTGLGFMITPPLIMVDLDHSYDRTTGTITDHQAAEIIQSLDSYTEASPGNGLHVLVYGNLPGKNIHTAIEMYGQDRFTTITTDHLGGTTTTIEQRQAAITALYNRFAPPIEQMEYQNTRWVIGSGHSQTELPPGAANDPLLQQLLQGNTTGFASSSNADFVLVLKLLHWTGDNVTLTRKLFCESGLYREDKTERKTGQSTYLDMTIRNALKKRRNPPMKP